MLTVIDVIYFIPQCLTQSQNCFVVCRPPKKKEINQKKKEWEKKSESQSYALHLWSKTYIESLYLSCAVGLSSASLPNWKSGSVGLLSWSSVSKKYMFYMLCIVCLFVVCLCCVAVVYLQSFYSFHYWVYCYLHSHNKDIYIYIPFTHELLMFLLK